MARWKPPKKADDLPDEVFTPNLLSDDRLNELLWSDDDAEEPGLELSRAELWRLDSGNLYMTELVGPELLSYTLDAMLSADSTAQARITNYGELRDHINRVFYDQGDVKFCRMMQTWLTSKGLKDAIFLLMEPPGYLTSDIVTEIDFAWEANSRKTMYP